MQYLNDVLDKLQERAYHRDRVNWDNLRRSALEMAQDARTPQETYAAIRRVIDALGDGHSWFVGAHEKETEGPTGKPTLFGVWILTPEYTVLEVFPDTAASDARIRAGDRVEQVNGVPVAEVPVPPGRRTIPLDTSRPLTLRLRRGDQTIDTIDLMARPLTQEPRPRGFLLRDDVGYLELFGQIDAAQQQEYIDTAALVISEVTGQGARRWIVDLRRNRGGNMWSMLAGAGPLLGEGLLGAFVEQYKAPTTWHYLNGAACYQQPSDPEPVPFTRAADPLPPFDPATTPIAVLTSGFTASAGEMTLVAFRGRPNTRVFGEPTAGQATAVAMYELEDGALLGIAETVTRDRAGVIYGELIAPDQPVTLDWTCIDQPNDPAIITALDWLKTITL